MTYKARDGAACGANRGRRRTVATAIRNKPGATVLMNKLERGVAARLDAALVRAGQRRKRHIGVVMGPVAVVVVVRR